MTDDWVSIFNTDKLYEAELIKQKLDNNGIDAVIVNKKDSSYIVFGEIEINVRKENQSKALELVKKYKS